MSQANFLRAVPRAGGISLLLVDTPPGRAERGRGDDRGRARATSAPTPRRTADRLAAVPPGREHLPVDVPDARRPRAAARHRRAWPRSCCATCSSGGASSRCSAPSATGARTFCVMVLAENALLLAGGLVAGAVCAGLAIAPAVAERGGRRAADERRSCCCCSRCSWQVCYPRSSRRGPRTRAPLLAVAAIGVDCDDEASESLRWRSALARRCAGRAARRRELAAVARTDAQRHQRRDESARQVVEDRERRLEAGDARSGRARRRSSGAIASS